MVNKDDILFYDPVNRMITIDHSGVSRAFSFDDIKRVERIMSFPLSENRLQWLPWDGYNHSIIRLKNGEHFLVTSLLVPNLDLPLEEEKIRLKKTFYRWASLNEDIEGSVELPDTFVETAKTKSTEELHCIIRSTGNQYDERFILAAKKELRLRGELE